MQYVLDKAIDLYKINRLTSKEKKELFEIIVVHQHGPYYANRILIECPNLITLDQRNILIKILMRNGDIAAKYFLHGEMNKEEREQLFSVIMNSLHAMCVIFINSCYEKPYNNNLSSKEVALFIKNLKPVNQYKKENEWYSKVVELTLVYIRDFFKGNNDLMNKFFQIMLGNTDFLKTAIFTVRTSYFNNKQRRIIYEKHSTKIFQSCKRSLNNIVEYCSYFYDLISYQEKAVLVEKVIMENNYY